MDDDLIAEIKTLLLDRLPEERTCMILHYSEKERAELRPLLSDDQAKRIFFRTFAWEGDLGVLNKIGLPIYADPRLPFQLGRKSPGALVTLNGCKNYKRSY